MRPQNFKHRSYFTQLWYTHSLHRLKLNTHKILFFYPRHVEKKHVTFLLQETKSGYHNTQQCTSGSTSQEFLASSRTPWLPLAGLEWRWGLNWPGAICSGDETKPTHDQRTRKLQEFWVLEGFLLDLNTQTDTSWGYDHSIWLHLLCIAKTTLA